ncbi:MAG TPA: non-canonical purine NTP pyrophosphatase [Candidatus Limnocylindria bacterium]|nr:non-canonical purine NTP pyrophosphatase [Candidatus Limnocylindria bacterium]
MTQIVFGTRNPGKLDDARLFVASGIELLTLADAGVDAKLDPEETGTTFEENAWIKYHAYRSALPEDTILVTEDSGMTIDALGGEPGVHSRRWNGSRMSDQEILDYCLEKMAGQKNRTAHFIVCTVIGGGGIEPQAITGSIDGVLLEKPNMKAFQNGFPFRALMYIPQLGKMMYEIHDTPPGQRPGFQTHREKIWQQIATLVHDLR